MKNKTISGILLGLLGCLLVVQTTRAEVHNEEKYEITTNAVQDWPQGPEVYSETAVLIDADTGIVLYDKGKDQPRYPASITKVMTTLLALEHSSMDEQVTFTESGLARMAEGSNINMQVGEVLTMEQCLYTVMIKSANEVAAQVAEHVGGSQEGFAQMMNERASQLGCTNTHFNNPSGLPDESHWTTANDMALIFQEALKNENFVEIIQTLQYTIPPTNMTAEARSFTCHHAMMVPGAPEYYEGCIGGKTGVTDASRNTLVTGAEKNGMTLIAVVMRADPGQVCADTAALFDYGFNSFERLSVEGGELTVPKGIRVEQLEEVSAEVESGLFTTYSFRDHTVGTALRVIAEEQPPEAEEAPTPETTPDEESGVIAEESAHTEDDSLRQTYQKIILVLGVLILLVLLLVIIKAAARSSRKKKKKRRKKR